MIKINLVDRGKREKKGISLDLRGLKGLKVQDLLKGSPEYPVGIISWLVLLGVGAYYINLNSQVGKLKKEVERLNTERAQLQAKAKEFLDRKKAIEEEINKLKKDIENIESSKDIIVGLKAYYRPFNATMDAYLSSLPKVSWVSSYRQSLDMNTGLIKSEFEISSLDYASASNYGQKLSRISKDLQISSVERKTNPHGIEYYTLKLTAVKEAEGR